MNSGACEACGLKIEECSETLNESSGLPSSWFMRRIDDRDYVLCDCCGSYQQFRGGITPYLQEALRLDLYARCEDLGEVKVMAAARAERRKKRVRKG